MKERYLQCSKEECDLLITLALKGDLENRFPLYIWTLYYVIFIGIAFAYMTMYYVRLGKTNITFMIGRIIISYSLSPSDLFHNLKKIIFLVGYSPPPKDVLVFAAFYGP